MIDILAVLFLLILFVLVAQMQPKAILEKAGIFCIVGGTGAVLHRLFSCAVIRYQINIGSYLQKILQQYQPDIVALMYDLLSIAVGIIFVCRAGKQDARQNTRLLILALLYLIPASVFPFFAFSSASVMLLISAIALVIGTIKQRILLRSDPGGR